MTAMSYILLASLSFSFLRSDAAMKRYRCPSLPFMSLLLCGSQRSKCKRCNRSQPGIDCSMLLGLPCEVGQCVLTYHDLSPDLV